MPNGGLQDKPRQVPDARKEKYKVDTRTNGKSEGSST
jgi:hypothetical protein